MLVKLGKTWFAADKVERIDPSTPPDKLVLGANGKPLEPLPDGRNNHYVSVRTFNCSDTTVAYFDRDEDARNAADQYAEIVNKANHPGDGK